MEQIIPRKIFQSWKTKNLPKEIQENVNIIKNLNPEYEYYLFDDNDCRNYLLLNFGENYANAFDEIKPGAFKCDFWRYAILYLEGGVYMDLDMKLLIPFRNFLKDNRDFISVQDRSMCSLSNMGCIYQAFIACKPKHPILKYALEMSFYNIISRKNEFLEQLSITGPIVMGNAVNLFLNRKNPYEKLEKGVYNQNNNIIELFGWEDDLYTTTNDGKKIILNKTEEYKPLTNYGLMAFQDNIYTTDPRKDVRMKKMLILFLILIIFILTIWYLRKRLISCEQTCKINY